MTALLRSPVSAQILEADTAHSLAVGGGERWPVIDDIAYLRTGRPKLVADVLARLDAGDKQAALALLLVDQDDWWTGTAPPEEGIARLVAERDALSFRAAMDLLGFGRVGDYLAHRWSDPTYLAGLALMEAHWRTPDRVFELACGTGAYLRELAQRGLPCSGGDVVFAKLWLARHWVVGPEVELICFDAGSPWPISGREHGMVLCHDAFYFLEPKADIAIRLREATAPDGLLALAHVHNAAHDNFSSGAAVAAATLAELFPGATFYDDGELTRALAEQRAPVPRTLDALRDVEAFSLVVGDATAPRPVLVGLALPLAGATLRKNPLYGDDGSVRWPSDRYRDEYAARATYPSRSQAPCGARCVPATEPRARTRELVDLPERW